MALGRPDLPYMGLTNIDEKSGTKLNLITIQFKSQPRIKFSTMRSIIIGIFAMRWGANEWLRELIEIWRQEVIDWIPLF